MVNAAAIAKRYRIAVWMVGIRSALVILLGFSSDSSLDSTTRT